MPRTCHVLRYQPVLWLLLLVVCGGPLGEAQATSCPNMEGLLRNGALAVADSSGRLLSACNPDQALVPASIVKVATVLAAMRVLGPDYRFNTGLYLDAANNLYIRGFGDPTLVSEEIRLIAARLHGLGLRRVNTLFVDDSAFALEGPTPGQTISDNPYDAPVGAVAVNFNTIAVFRNKQGLILSGEPQTPTLPLMQELAQGRAPGRMRLNICCDGAEENSRAARHATELFQAILRETGIEVRQIGGSRITPANARLLLMHSSSQDLRAISATLMHSSSNFMANLVFLQTGARRLGYPATWEKARAVMRAELRTMLGPELAQDIVMVEGSGLSRENSVSARSMLALLQHFRPYQKSMRQESGIARKTGTLSGVYNLAGYLPNGHAFVIMLNQPANNREAVLHRLWQRHGSSGPQKNAVAKGRE